MRITLNKIEHELVIECVKLCQRSLDNGVAGSSVHKLAGEFTSRRMSELLIKLENVDSND